MARIRARAPSFRGLRAASDATARAKRASVPRDTKPELLLRRSLWKLGLRYRLHVKGLPGRPDLVFPRDHVAVFVDGDFWHGRDWAVREGRLSEGSNAGYWTAKIAYNIERDARNSALLQEMGWTVVRVWEGDVSRSPDSVAQTLLDTLTQRRLERIAAGRHQNDCSELDEAAPLGQPEEG
jgi:DNA mismatch endonuclease (patch repair protein)